MELSAIRGISEIEHSIEEIVALAEQAFQTTEDSFCGDIDYELLNEPDFLYLDKHNFSLQLIPHAEDEIGIYNEATI